MLVLITRTHRYNSICLGKNFISAIRGILAAWFARLSELLLLFAAAAAAAAAARELRCRGQRLLWLFSVSLRYEIFSWVAGCMTTFTTQEGRIGGGGTAVAEASVLAAAAR